MMYEEVNTYMLEDWLQMWVDTFNDCACCPLSDRCDREGGIDSIERLGDVSLDIIKIKLDKNTINDEIPVATYFMSSNGN